jgi:glyceraldehyde-3-phosphate dehydrogenase (NAD(P))
LVKAKVKVGLAGYGVIGKRVADAVALQDDMELFGIAEVSADYRIRAAIRKKYPIYASLPEKAEEMKKNGVELAGNLQDLLKEVDVMIDCTPAGVGAKNKPLYEKNGVKAIFQGGEKHSLVQASFVAQCNYEEALGKDFVRVVSCNTTGLCRVISALHNSFKVKKARVALMRRAVDPWESHLGGVINTVLPETHVPSHQGPDAQTILHDLNIVAMAAKGPFNLSHLHFAMIEINKDATTDDAIKAFMENPRTILVNASNGIAAPNSVIEFVRDLGRPRGDLWEVAVWGDILTVDQKEKEVYIVYQVHNEAIVVPENIDAVRAMTGLEENATKSISKTDKSLGIMHGAVS